MADVFLPYIGPSQFGRRLNVTVDCADVAGITIICRAKAAIQRETVTIFLPPRRRVIEDVDRVSVLVNLAVI